MIAAFEEEPRVLLEDEIYLRLRSSEPPRTPELRAFCEALRRSCGEVSRICGQKLSRADGSAYVYLPGHYLLPHSDSRPGEGRAIAYAYYVGAPEEGGELELFACTRSGGEIIHPRVAMRLELRANRPVLLGTPRLARNHDSTCHVDARHPTTCI